MVACDPYQTFDDGITVIQENQKIIYNGLMNPDVSLLEDNNCVYCGELLGSGNVSHLFKQVPFILYRQGSFIIQTLHPVVACGEDPYEDGWRARSWDASASSFTSRRPGILGRLILGRSFFIGMDLYSMKLWSRYTHIPRKRHRLFLMGTCLENLNDRI